MTDVAGILAEMDIERRLEAYVYAFGHSPQLRELADAVIEEDEGTTYIATRAACEAADAPIAFECAWLTVTVHTALDGVGLTAALSRALAEAQILQPAGWVSQRSSARAVGSGRRGGGGARAAADVVSETFAGKPTIVGERVILRPMVAGDSEAMWADLADPEAMRLTGTHASFTREAIDTWAAARGEQPDRLDLAVTDARTGAWLGEVVINDWDPDNGCCGFRIALSASARGRGAGTEATRLIVDHVFSEHADVHRIELEVYAFNPRARAVYERVGFVVEGVRRDALRWDGEWVDAIGMAMLRPAWEARRHQDVP